MIEPGKHAAASRPASWLTAVASLVVYNLRQPLTQTRDSGWFAPGGANFRTGRSGAFTFSSRYDSGYVGNGMQNGVIAAGLALLLRLFRGSLRLLGVTFVRPRARAAGFDFSAFSFSVDLDSARLDAVSRSLWWGSGVLIRGPVPTAACPAPARSARGCRQNAGLGAVHRRHR